MLQREFRGAMASKMQREERAFIESLPTAPGITRLRRYARALLKGERPPGFARLILGLLALGVLLELCLLTLYPLWFHLSNASLQAILNTLWPWMMGLYRLSLVESLLHLIDIVPLSLLVLLVGMCLQVPLWWLGGKARCYQDRAAQGTIRGIILGISVFLALTMILAPLGSEILSRDMLQSGLYGRMVVLYSVNPYAVKPQMFPQDIVVMALGKAEIAPLSMATAYGPVWLDVNLLLTLVVREHVGWGLLGLRLVGMASYLLTIILLWHITRRMRPEWSIGALLLYAWNPLVLVLGIGQMHVEIVAICFLCVVFWCWQRGALLAGWLFLLLTALLYLPCTLLLPLGARFLLREYALSSAREQRFWLWSRIVLLSLFVLLMTYAPYWQNWGWSGLGDQIWSLFWTPESHNSLPSGLAWLLKDGPVWLQVLVQPGTWAFVEIAILACCLVFSLWFAHTLDLVAICAGWLLLVLACLYAVYRPEAMLVPLVLILYTGNRRSVSLLLLLGVSGLVSYYYWLRRPAWEMLGLICVCLPFLLWGWGLCIRAGWMMARARAVPEEPVKARKGLSRFTSRFSRPGWLTRPSLRIAAQRRQAWIDTKRL